MKRILTFVVTALFAMQFVTVIGQTMPNDDGAAIMGNDQGSRGPGNGYTCDANSIFGQAPLDDSPVYYGLYSDTLWGHEIYDNFSGVNGSIRIVDFWGFFQSWNGNQWVSCNGDPMDFIIKFYDNATTNTGEDTIGNLVSTFTFQNVRGYATGKDHINKYSVTLPSAVNLSDGWIMIQNVHPSCTFFWKTSANNTGAHSSIVYRGKDNPPTQDWKEYDLAFCLYDIAGAPVPLSDWAIVFGVFLMLVFVAFRFKAKLV